MHYFLLYGGENGYNYIYMFLVTWGSMNKWNGRYDEQAYRTVCGGVPRRRALKSAQKTEKDSFFPAERNYFCSNVWLREKLRIEV